MLVGEPRCDGPCARLPRVGSAARQRRSADAGNFSALWTAPSRRRSSDRRFQVASLAADTSSLHIPPWDGIGPASAGDLGVANVQSLCAAQAKAGDKTAHRRALVLQ